MIDVKIVGGKLIVKHVEAVSKLFFPLVKKKWNKLGWLMVREIVQEQLSGPPYLSRRTGTAAKSFVQKTTNTIDNVEQRFFFLPPANKYIPPHQFGATIRPTKAQYLHFKTSDGNWVRTKKVVIPKRLLILEDLKGEKNTSRRRNAIIEASKEAWISAK